MPRQIPTFELSPTGRLCRRDIANCRKRNQVADHGFQATFLRHADRLAAISRVSDLHLAQLPFDATAAQKSLTESVAATIKVFKDFSEHSLAAMTKQMHEGIPNNGWEACVDTLSAPENKAMLDSLVGNEHFKKLATLAGHVDADLKGLKSLHTDGFGDLISRDILKNASTQKTRAVLACGLTYLYFTIQRLIVVQPDYDTRHDVISQLRTAMKGKQITIPKDAEEILTKADDPKFQIAAACSAAGAAGAAASSSSGAAAAASVAVPCVPQHQPLRAAAAASVAEPQAKRRRK